MLRAFYDALLRGYRSRRARMKSTVANKTGRFTPSLEPLTPRVVPAVIALFSSSSGVLSVFGDNLDNSIEVSRNAAGII